jgi:Ca2+/H+ antiporter, TMEM165/GDT1 family
VVDGFDFAYVAAAALAGFFASFVECVEVLVVVLALTLVRGWPVVLAGSSTGLLVLFFATRTLVAYLASVPSSTVHLIVGVLLVLFGLRWLREAMLRFLGAFPLPDLAASYAKEVTAIGALKRADAAFDFVAAARALKTMICNGVEVAFVVAALGAGDAGLLAPAAAGALVSALVIVPFGFVFYRPIAAPIVNSLKLAAGVLLSAFGTIWAGNGIGTEWPRVDVAIVVLAAGYLLVAIGYVRMARRGSSADSRGVSG